MKILVIDDEFCGLPFSMRCQDAGHKVLLWQSKEKGNVRCEIGDGIVEKVAEWQPKMKWADLIIVTGNSKYAHQLSPYYQDGYPIVGANPDAAALELDREVGQDVMDNAGLAVLEYEKFSNYDKAIAYVKSHKKPFVSKPWGGNSDKNLSYVPSSWENLICRLERWKEEGLKPDFLLQEMVEGQEIAVGAWFGPGGFSRWINENWEEKKFQNDGYGPTTGEMGTVMRYVKRSKIFDEVLKPMEEALDARKYVGYIDTNCIVDSRGTPWPLEFTARFGWPHFDIASSLHEGDPAEWLEALTQGRDVLECSTGIAVGVVMTLGDYPWDKWPLDRSSNWPINGLTPAVMKKVSLSHVKMGTGPKALGSEKCYVTAGEYVLVVTGTGETVEAAREDAYATVDKIDWPCHTNLRTDIGCRLEEDLPKLQKWDFAKGLSYGRSE